MEKRKLERQPVREKPRIRQEYTSGEDAIIRAFEESKRKGTEILIQEIHKTTLPWRVPD